MENKNINKNNWDLLGKKVSEYTPDEYTPDSWNEFEQGLDQPSKTVVGISLRSAIPIAILSILSAAFLFLVIKNSSKFTGEIAPENNAKITLKDTKQINNSTAQTTLQNNLNKEENLNLKTQTTKTQGTSQMNDSIKNKAKNSNNLKRKDSNTKQNILSKKSTFKLPAHNNSSLSHIATNELRSDRLVSFARATTGPSLEEVTILENDSKFKTVSTLIEANTSVQKQEAKLNAESNEEELIAFDPLKTFVGGLIHNQFKIKEYNYDHFEKVPNKIKFGIKAGLNNTITDYTTNTTSHLPFAGIFISKELNRKWSLQFEVSYKLVDNYDLVMYWSDHWYDHRGWGGSNYYHLRRTGYRSFDFPFILKHKLPSRLSFFGGLRYSFITLNQGGVTNKTEWGPKQSANPIDPHVPLSAFWQHDFGLIIGLEYPLSRSWVLDLRYTQGIRDITPDNLYVNERNILVDDESIHMNSDLQLSINYIF